MGQCINHADRGTNYVCLKHQAYVCEACLDCHDPHTYCKFRPQCLIYFIWKERNSEKVQSATEAEKDEDRKIAAKPC